MITWFMALFGVLFVTATLEYTNPGDITPEEWRLIHEAETQTCSELSLADSERRAAWDARVTERAQLIGYSDDHLATFIASDGNCGPECIALGNVLPDDEGVPDNWEQDHGTMASSVRLHTSRFLQVNENRQVSSMGLSIGNLHVRAEEPYEDFARRMGRPNEFIEMPFFAAAAIVYNRPIVVVSGHGTDPMTGGYFIFSPGSSTGYTMRPIVILHRWGGNHFTLASQVREQCTPHGNGAVCSLPVIPGESGPDRHLQHNGACGFTMTHAGDPPHAAVCTTELKTEVRGSRDALREYLQLNTRQCSFSWETSRSDSSNLQVHCSSGFGGHAKREACIQGRSTGQRVAAAYSHKTDCQARMNWNYQRKSNIWRLTTFLNVHNHGVLKPTTIITKKNELTTEMLSFIGGLVERLQLGAAAVLKQLEDRFSIHVTAKIISNLVAGLRKERFQYGSPLEASVLVTELGRQGMVDARLDESGRLVSLVFLPFHGQACIEIGHLAQVQID